MINKLLEELELIYYNVENRNWESIKNIIISYKKAIEKQRNISMQMFTLLFDSMKELKTLPIEKQEKETEKIISIHCILQDDNINVEICKNCKNQCIKYKKYIL